MLRPGTVVNAMPFGAKPQGPLEKKEGKGGIDGESDGALTAVLASFDFHRKEEYH